MGDRLDLNAQHELFKRSDTDLQYVTPQCHRELLSVVVETDRIGFGRFLESCLALSLRVDGAVDRQCVDNKHIMAKCVTRSGETKTLYLGFSESEERGSVGLYHAVQVAAEKSGISWNALFRLSSSIVTGGASENTGEHQSLWTLLTKEKQDNKLPSMPLLKIWCGVHRSQLAFKNVTANVPEVAYLISDCKAVINFNHMSAVRRKAIIVAGIECGSGVVEFSSVNDTRFTEYSYAMLSSFLTNYRTLVKHLESLSDAEARGILRKWRDQDTVHLAAVMCDTL
jgi:hypothetical protein